MKFGELVKNSADIIQGHELEITSIVRDSRSIVKGSCFLVCKGQKYDGFEFIKEALKGGAKAIISDRKINIPNDVGFAISKDSMKTWGIISSRWFEDPSEKMKIIGITGTNGKTTSTYLLESVFKSAKLNSGVIGTIEYRYDSIKKTADRTTPDAYVLQELFSNMIKKDVNAIAMEVSSHAIDQKRIAGTKFAGAIFTNLTPEHLDYHISMENYFESKAKLFNNYLTSDSFVAVNIDDEYGRRLASDLKNVNVWTYGFAKDSRVRANNLNLGNDGIEFDIILNDKTVQIKSSLYGKFNAYNILGVYSACLALGIDVDQIKSGIEKVKNIPGRAEVIQNDKGVLALVDYAHTPDALENILKQVRLLTDKKIIVVFGCGGDRDKAKRSVMGEISAKLADVVIVTDDNPRTEESELIREQIFEGVKRIDSSKGSIVTDRRNAILRAVKIANKGDVLLLAGKGHEDYQEINNVKYPFDDRKVLAEAFND